ncbi:U2 snRNP component IST3, putative [Entamoeba invadens IP1]|uniref:U2 snRNP component IST3, putative n=1 Tax=Entamoeba invadens IP1 TaxID=370355 RepID=A0A0A1TUV6_ENTIV|nr:U2 snRNP component IST3, putative [Entamoeba invadens IP1]ELP83929.1 U2 snRNP component IST3, putative [Entamoeba invadens IP1]|eukprot:XP_004183275.1 U2 snRNP component IST3, putative [Entamoeba invadens IP1]
MSNFQKRQQNIQRLSEQDLEFSSTYESSWHYRYKENREIYIGGIAPELNEGDIIVVFSQYGEVIDIHMPWDSEGDRHKGFCLLTYKNPKSCVLAVDNLNGIVLNEKMLIVDHSEGEVQKHIDEKYGKYNGRRPPM